MRALRRQTLFLHLTAGAPAGKPAACRLICSPDGCGAVALSDAGRSCEAKSELQMNRRRDAAADVVRLCGRRRMRTPDGLDEAKYASQKNRRRDAAFERLCGGMRPTARTDRGTDIAVRNAVDAAARASASENTGPSLSARRAARGALFPTGTRSRFAPLLYAGGCGVKRKGRFCRARAGRHNNAYGKLWG